MDEVTTSSVRDQILGVLRQFRWSEGVKMEPAFRNAIILRFPEGRNLVVMVEDFGRDGEYEPEGTEGG